jgi:Zn-dependent protease
MEPGRTPYDVNFRLLGFPVRIHPLFWLAAGLLGADFLQKSVTVWLLWIVVVFISVLVHEMGHALMFRRYGRRAAIVLYAFGGIAIPDSGVAGRLRRILIALAGPLTGFLLAALLFGSNFFTHWVSASGLYVSIFYSLLVMTNIYWGIFNLLPVFPLDGGQVAKEVCEARTPSRGFRISLQISVWTAALLALYSFVCVLEIQTQRYVLLNYLPGWFPQGGVYTGILFAVLAMQSYQLLQQIGPGRYYFEGPDDRLPWER